MKWKFRLLRKASLRLISLLSMVIGISCKRNAPRYEPESLKYYDIDPHNPHNLMKDPNVTQTPNGSKTCNPVLSKLHEYYKFLKDDLSDLLKKIGCSNLLNQLRSGQLSSSKELKKEVLLLNLDPTLCHPLENKFNALVEANQATLARDGKEQTSRLTSDKLPNKLCVLFDRYRREDFDRDREHVSWDERSLVGAEALIMSSNPLLRNSEKHSFALTAFLVHRPSRHDSSNQVVAFIKLGEQWHYYKDGETIALLNNQAAIRLASEMGTLFFYEKTAG